MQRNPAKRRCATEPGVTVRTARQLSGDAAERAAADHLVNAGCRLLARNARCAAGEVDLVVGEGEVVVFVEVRMRRSATHGGAGASIDAFKQQRVGRAAQHWLLKHYGQRWPACRFDVVTVDGSGTIEWIRDAFTV